MKYSKEKLQEAVQQSNSISEVVRLLGSKSTSGSVHCHVSKMVRKYGIDISHFRKNKHQIGRQSCNKLSHTEVLVYDRFNGRKDHTEIIRRAMIEYGIIYECFLCKNTGLWLGRNLALEIDHIDGNPLNNQIENLRFLCPNCHTQTETYGYKGIS